jgi:outer membrane protein OmpA-like peptidoglycan-associated protein/uncharacterized coiled-coil protein SlyX
MVPTQKKRSARIRLLAMLLAGSAVVGWGPAGAAEPTAVDPPAPSGALGSLNQALADFRARVEAVTVDGRPDAALSGELAAAHERIDELERAEATQRAGLDELTQTLRVTEAELSLRGRTLTALEERVDAAEEARAAAEARAAELTTRAGTDDAELAAAREQVKRGEAEIAVLRGLRDEATAQIAELERELENDRSQVAKQAALVAERDRLQEDLSALHETVRAERQETGALVERHAALETEAGQLRDRAAELAARVTDLEAGAGRSAAEIDAMADELIGQLQQGNALAALVGNLRDEREALRASLGRERGRAKLLQTEVTRLEAEAATDQREDSSVAAAAPEPALQTATGEPLDTIDKERVRLAEVERERDRIAAELIAVKQVAGGKLDAMVEAEARVADLTAELERTRAELQRVRAAPVAGDQQGAEVEVPAAAELQFAALEAEGLRFDRSPEGWLVAIADGIEFASESATLAPGADRTLAKVAELLAAYPGRPVLIRGHTDGLGDAGYNQALSADRAEAVREFLAGRFRIDAERIDVEGLGESRPIASNDTAQGRRANRRVEIVIRD